MISLATDLVLKRQFFQQKLMLQLHQQLLTTLLLQEHDNRERIVNRDGKVISRWK